MSPVFGAFVESMRGWFGLLKESWRGVALPAAEDENGLCESDSTTGAPSFDRWLRNPMVADRFANRYCDDAPGRLTSNGLGSLEIGAADD